MTRMKEIKENKTRNMQKFGLNGHVPPAMDTSVTLKKQWTYRLNARLHPENEEKENTKV
jgi:hypothetical protein